MINGVADEITQSLSDEQDQPLTQSSVYCLIKQPWPEIRRVGQ